MMEEVGGSVLICGGDDEQTMVVSITPQDHMLLQYYWS